MMRRKVTITTDQSALYNLLKARLPRGVFISSQPSGARDLDSAISIDINFVVDLAEIMPLAFSVYLINRTRRLKGNHTVKINDKEIPVDLPHAVELVTKEIEKRRQNQSQ
jgi:hypothetical protein